jgi:hypothetical protein
LKSFVLSSRELSKLAIMALLATAAFGLSGLIMILIMQLMTMQSYAVDSMDKHGISQVQSSRLGGVAVAIGGGGCGHHKFEMKQNGFLMKSLPPKQPVQIIHLSTVDQCRALINVDLKFDISSFRGTPHGTTVLLLKNWTSDIIYSY